MADRKSLIGPRERLVRHGRAPSNAPRSLIRALKAFWRVLLALAPLAAPFVAFKVYGTPGQDFLGYLQGHLSLFLLPLLPLLAMLHHSSRNRSRTHPRQRKGGPKVLPRPPLPSTGQWNRDINDIIANLDLLPLRLLYLVLLVGAVAAAGHYFPLSLDALRGLKTVTPDQVRALLLSVAIPVVAFAVPRMRCAFVNRKRLDEIDECYIIAKAALGYKDNRSASMAETTPWLAVNVRKWWALYEIDLAFVLAPSSLSVDDTKAWDSFTVNLNAKMPRPEEWRIQRDPKGRGAQIGPANYPTAILWDGEYDPDPLTFVLGVNLETGEQQVLTLNDTSPHVACSGGTSSGKLLSLSTIVLTPQGPRRVGDLKVGDELFDEKGRIVTITSMSEITRPEKAYRVRFHDDTTVDVSDTHPWTTWDRSARRAASRQRRQGHERARQPWLSDKQRAILAAEIEVSSEGDDITVQQVIALVGGEAMSDRPFYETARAIGACREQQRTTTYVYAEQIVKQEQTCMLFDRSEVQTLVTAMANSPRAAVREAASSVKVLERNGEGPVSVPELTQVTGIDRTRMRGLVKRSGVTTLRKERVVLDLSVPAKEVTRGGTTTDVFYPKRPLLEALIERGLRPSRDQRHLMSMPKVRTTQEIADTLRYQSAGAGEDAQTWANHSIPRSGPAQFPERNLPMDPYVLGAWLGDGSTGSDGFTGIDPEIWGEFERVGYDVSHYPDGKSHTIKGAIKGLRAAGVLRNKHIPDDYLYGSIEQRLALLQGLMDTDGSVKKTSGTCEFYSSDEALARQVRSLVASLGMIAHLRSKPSGYKDAEGVFIECKQAWTVSFAPTMQVFRLPRKVALIDPETNRAKAEHRYIVAVEPVEPEPMRCIMVNSDSHQFLVTDQYVPTHNTSAAEIIAAQVLIKPMPWDPDLHGMVVIVDPKGPFARRWRGRPGVVVSDGQSDSAVDVDDDGNPLTGLSVMASCMDWLEEEHQRRARVLAAYPDVSTWLHLPDEVKRAERFFPILVVLDEYIDHTDIEKSGGDERVERENSARQTITRLANLHARKYRNVGMHTFLIAQRVNMSIIGNVLMSNLPVRIITGQMDRSQTETMFATTEVPSLPATRVVFENGERRVKTIPGRARIMNALGQAIHKVQVMWFGGPSNSDTLDKWLPRGEAPLNGDFSLPTGKPRSAADFDAEGNLIATGEPPATEGLAVSAEPGEGDTDGDGEPDGVNPEAEEEMGGPLPDPSSYDPASVFPAAHAGPPMCATDCVNEATSVCSVCGEPFCGYHLKASPDPAERGWFCPGCVAAHPVTVSGAAEVYAAAYAQARDAGLETRLTIQGPDAVLMTVLTPGERGRKVLVMSADAGALTVESKAGTRTGAEVPSRVEEIISAYQKKQAASVAAGVDAAGEDGS